MPNQTRKTTATKNSSRRCQNVVTAKVLQTSPVLHLQEHSGSAITMAIPAADDDDDGGDDGGGGDDDDHFGQ